MKSRFQNNLDGAKDMGAYFELPLQQFIRQMPQYAYLLADTPIDFNDTNYIVRFRFLKNGRIDFEVGYPEDAEWRIGQPDESKKLSLPSEHKEIEKLLDEEIAKGGSCLVLPISEYLEKYPKEKVLFANVENAGKAVCFFRDNNNFMQMTVGEKSNTDDDWLAIIECLRRT